MKILASLAFAAATAGLAAPAFAQFAKPDDAIKYRQSGMFVMAQHFGRIGAMANGRVPFDAKVAAENAEIVAEMAKLPFAGFGPGYESGTLKTTAKPEIWTQQAKFKEGADKLQAETVKLAAAAKTGNLDTLKTAFGAVGGTCKSCHDSFRTQ
jgi:cytochrome c556